MLFDPRPGVHAGWRTQRGDKAAERIKKAIEREREREREREEYGKVSDAETNCRTALCGRMYTCSPKLGYI
jgi:hypothetical protein